MYNEIPQRWISVKLRATTWSRIQMARARLLIREGKRYAIWEVVERALDMLERELG